MACNFIIAAKGHQKKDKVCSQPDTLNGRCAKHQPPPPTVTATGVTYHWTLHTEGGGTKVNEKLQTACDEGKEQIDKCCEKGPVLGGEKITGKQGNKKGPFMLHHETQPRANFAFFYNWQGNTMHVYAAGGHTGNDNKHYKLTWFDGSSASITFNPGGDTTLV